MTPQEASELIFLALCVWREARGEKDETKAGVIHSILNRAFGKPGWWGKDVMTVVFKKWQYSSMTAPGDPNLVVWPLPSDPSWQTCLNMANDAIDANLPNPVGEADSYYDLSIKPPNWATPENFVVQLGRLRFHKVQK